MKRISQCITPLILFLLLMGCREPIELVADITPPAEVTELTVDKQDVNVALSWIDPTDEDLRGIQITLYNADNKNEISVVNVLPDSLSYVFENLAAGNYTVKVKTRDYNNKLSEGIKNSFTFLSKAPINVKNLSTAIYWNVLHLEWDLLKAEDFVVSVNGEEISNPIDSIVVILNDTLRIQLTAADTGLVIPDLPDGRHSIKLFTRSIEGYYSSIYTQSFSPITFGEKFVRVKGDGRDFYIARYEVTTGEYKTFVLETIQAKLKRARYYVDPSKVEPEAWYANWYGKDPVLPGEMRTIAGPSDTYEFAFLDGPVWRNNRYIEPNGAFGKITWEGAMLYCLINYNGRCPTQAEWLYAAKGGPLTHNYDYSGSNNPDEVGWWGLPVAPNYWNAQNVGTKLPNELGIYDMSGNAGEILYEFDPDGVSALGKTIIIGGSMGCEHFYSNEGEMFDLPKPKLTDPEIVKHTGILTNYGGWRMGCRVLIPHTEIVKLPFNRHKYEL